MRRTFAVLAVLTGLLIATGAQAQPTYQRWQTIRDAFNAVRVPVTAAKCSAGETPVMNAGATAYECASASAAITAGAGLADTSGTWATASTEANFLASGALTCGASTQGKMKVHTTALQYCDNAATPTLQYAAYGNSAGAASVALTLVASAATITGTTVPITGKVANVPQAVTVADSGDGSAATATLTPSSSFVELTCSDTDGCTITLSETGAADGQALTVVNVSANAATFADTSGVSETAGSFAAGQYDSISYRYVVNTWVETGRSNN